jgi:hypothetical protein
MIVIIRTGTSQEIASEVTSITEMPRLEGRVSRPNEIEMFRGTESLGTIKTNESTVEILPED